MKRTITMIALVFAVLVLAGTTHGQTFALTGTTNVSVTVATEAALSVSTATSTLTAAAGTFANDFTGTTALLYKIRTTKAAGTGSITARVTTDFAAGGPSVTTPPSTGDALTYNCTVAAPGTKCADGQIASTAAATPVASFGADAKSLKAGTAASVAWTLTNDPLYSTGSYSATVTFTISAT